MVLRLSYDFIERVRQGNNLVDIVGSYTELRRAGNQWMGLCPFPQHNEKTPSFSISEERQVYHCFGCKRSGNVYHFVQELQGMSFLDSVEYLAHRIGIDLPQYSGDQKSNENKQAWKINQIAAEFFHKNLLCLPPTHFVKQYCLQRGISDDMIKEFFIGYAPETWKELEQHLQKQNYSPKIAASLGLLKERNTTGFYDAFRGRLMFPIIVSLNRYVGFGGRVLGEGQPKYLNSPESFVFHKGETLYGLNWTAKYIRTEAYTILVEGYMDFLALQRAGIKNVVATMGTALTEDHCRKLGRLIQKVVVLFDGDEAGQKAAQRSLPLLLRQKIHPRICLLDQAKDPDDFLKSKGPEALKSAIKASRDFFIYTTEKIIHEVGIKEASDKLLVVDQLAPIYAHVKDSRLKEIYLLEMSRLLNMERSLVRKALYGNKEKSLSLNKVTQKQMLPQKQIPQDTSGFKEEIFILKGASKEEIYLLNLALISEESLKVIRDADLLEEFLHPGVREALTWSLLKYKKDPTQFGKLVTHLSLKVDCVSEICRYLEPPIAQLDERGVEKLIKDCCRRIREKFMKIQAKKLSYGLKSKTTTEQLEQLEQIMHIHKARYELKGIYPKNFESRKA